MLAVGCRASDDASCGEGQVASGDQCLPRCSSTEVPLGSGCSPVGVRECGAGFAADGHGGCDPVLPSAACTGATMAAPGDTTCRAVGVATCGKGFASDGRGGCTATVPSTSCPDGRIAVPGDSACREVSPCGTDAFGDPPTDAPILHVDAGYSGGGSDGTSAKPFVTLAAALDAAAPTAPTTIAIAEGTYDGNLDVLKPVRLYGRCPAKVTIRGKSGDTTPVLRLSAKGAAVHRVAVTGGAIGIDVAGADATIAETWVHGVDSFGVRVQRTSNATIRASLVERATTIGIDVFGSSARIEATLVRATRARADGAAGNGIEAGAVSASSPADVSISGSVVEQSAAAAILVTSSKATIEATLVRDNRPVTSNPLGGRGIVGQSSFDTQKSSITVRGSVIERNRSEGLAFYGTDGVVEDTVVRGSRPDGSVVYGAITVSYDLKTPLRSAVTVKRTLVDDNTGMGVLTVGSTTAIEDSLVRGTHAIASKNLTGIGVRVEPDAPTKNAADVTLRGSVIESSERVGASVRAAVLRVERSAIRDSAVGGVEGEATAGPCAIDLRGSLVERTHGVGVNVKGVDLTIDATLIRDTLFASSGQAAGVFLQPVFDGARGSLSLTGSVIRHNAMIGVLVQASTATIERCTIDDTQPSESGLGLGVTAQVDRDHPDAPELVVRDSLVARNVAAGIVCIGGTATIERTLVRETKATSGGKFGDGVVSAVSQHGRDVLPSTVTLTASAVRDNARAGVGVFGGAIGVGGSALQCNRFDLGVESFAGEMGQLTDGGGNVCGCNGELAECRGVTSGLEPVVGP